jgi:uncharacterized protein YggE
MKTCFIISLLLAIGSLSRALAQSPPQPPLITVSGSSEVKVAPDIVCVRVGVETRNRSLDQAKRENDERVAKALAFLKVSEIKPKDVQTDYISIEPTYDSNVSRERPDVYVARKSIEIKLSKVESFEGILTGLLTNGVNFVHGIDFRTSELRKHRDAARTSAIRAAREKADALAAELGVKRGKAYTINETDWGNWGYSGSYWGGSYGRGIYQNSVQNASSPAEPTGDTLSIGQISVSATVNVSFLIE